MAADDTYEPTKSLRHEARVTGAAMDFRLL